MNRMCIEHGKEFGAGKVYSVKDLIGGDSVNQESATC